MPKTPTAQSTSNPSNPSSSSERNGKYQSLVKHCLDLYHEFKKSEYRQSKLQEIEDSILAYEQTEEYSSFPWDDAYNLHMPFTTVTVDNLEPRFVAGLVGRDPIISLGDNKIPQEQLIEDWYNTELKDIVKVKDAARKVTHTILKEGTWFGLTAYDTQEKEVKDFQFDEAGNIVIDPETSTPVMNTTTATIFEGGKIDTIPFSDVFIPDNVGTREEWEECDKIVKRYPTLAALMRSKSDPTYMNIGTWLVSEKSSPYLTQDSQSPSQSIVEARVTGKETIECIECYVTFPIQNLRKEPLPEEEMTDFTEHTFIVTIALESETIIRFRRLLDVNLNNQSILKRVRLFPEEGRSYGTSMYGKMKSIQKGSSKMFSLLMNIAVICMIPWYFYEEGTGVEQEYEIVPGKGVPVPNIDKIKFPDFKINPNQYIEFIKLWISLWERIEGLSDPQIGKTTESKRTATEILSVIEEGNIKHNYQSTTFKEEFLDILRTLYDLYYQYMPYDKTITVNLGGEQGEQEVNIRPFMRRPDNFILTGSTEKANKLIERKENEDIYTLLRQDPMTNPIKLIEDLLQSYGRKNVADYINPQMGQLAAIVQEHPEIMDIMMQMLQGGGGQEGGGGQGQEGEGGQPQGGKQPE